MILSGIMRSELSRLARFAGLSSCAKRPARHSIKMIFLRVETLGPPANTVWALAPREEAGADDWEE
ncbi:hypothetical protein CN311_15325 [Mesorhizobium sanjuanii]|uniref:Uncharacterized protein n=1 Tax=Mesorhizobium sanjuanii TaxID=2037900 RepID=A0A2A6FDY1_9HYPH|nr:hypothetical protein CN311_15325 [Mesorhizobium sanjuanii]